MDQIATTKEKKKSVCSRPKNQKPNQKKIATSRSHVKGRAAIQDPCANGETTRRAMREPNQMGRGDRVFDARPGGGDVEAMQVRSGANQRDTN